MLDNMIQKDLGTPLKLHFKRLIGLFDIVIYSRKCFQRRIRKKKHQKISIFETLSFLPSCNSSCQFLLNKAVSQSPDPAEKTLTERKWVKQAQPTAGFSQFL